MALMRVFLEDYDLSLPLLTLRGKNHLEGRDLKTLSVLLSRDHSDDFRLLLRLPKCLFSRLCTIYVIYSPSTYGLDKSISDIAISLCYSGYREATSCIPQA